MNITELHATLNSQKGGLDRWAHSRLNAVESNRQKHEVEIKNASEEYEELEEAEQKILSEVKNLNESIQEENKEAQELNQKLNLAKKSSTLLPEELRRLKDEVNLKRDLLQQRQAESQQENEGKQSKLSSLQALASFYGEKLGLNFQHSNDQETNALRIGFTQIDRRNTDKNFWFDVRIMEDETYAIQQVVPEISGLKELEDELNADNDFSKFVRNIRKKFKETV
jgi:chromosome segregation ATPase